MGLKDVFKAAAVTAIQAMGDVPVSTNYCSRSSTTYNASAGTNTVKYASVHGVFMIVDQFRRVGAPDVRFQDDNFDVEPQDELALIAATHISAITPKPMDKIVSKAKHWEVIHVFTDPAEALWRLQVRRT